MRSTQENSTLSMRYTKTDTIRLLPCDSFIISPSGGKVGSWIPSPQIRLLCQGTGGNARRFPVMPGAGPASTSDGVETAERRGWWAFHHDGEETAVPPARYFNAYGLP